MKTKSVLLLLTTFFFFVYLVKSVSATSFTASVSPLTINASATQQLNFTITNLNDTENITKTDIILPSGISYDGSPLPSGGFSHSGQVLTWTTIIENKSSQKFSVNVISDIIGSRNFSISTSDTADNDITNTTNNITIQDATPPKWSGNDTSPHSPAIYSSGATYQFTIAWRDNFNVSNVIFSLNGTNYTYPNVTNSSGVYSIVLTDFPVDSYSYYWWANDTSGNINYTSELIFIVNKTNNPINLWFNTTKNQNITVVNATTLLANATGVGDLTLFIDGAQENNTQCISSCNLLYTISLYSTSRYNFTVTANGNENYTSNSSTYFVMVVPGYDTSGTSIPSTYSPTTSTVFKIVFSSASGLDNLFLESDYSGSTVRYKMTNSSTTIYTYAVTLPAGTFHWQIYGNYSGYIFSLTPRNTFTIAKATPSISLVSFPGWSVTVGTKITVTCAASPSSLSIKLYRDGTEVSNPDTQTFSSVRNHLYLCNSTATENYSSATATNTLVITSAPTANLSFVEVPTLIIITQNSTNTTLVSVENTGNVYQNITFTIEDINESWWSVNTTNVNLAPNAITGFSVTFSIGNETLGNYSGVFNCTTPNITISSNFTLRVLPSEETKSTINGTIANYKIREGQLELEINQTKSRGGGTSLVEQIFTQLKDKISQAENFTNNGDYKSAEKLFSTIDNLFTATQSELTKVQQNLEQQKQSSLLFYAVVIAVAVVIVGVLAYLFWPTEVKPKIPSTELTTKEPSKKSVWKKLKERLVRKKKYKYRG